MATGDDLDPHATPVLTLVGAVDVANARFYTRQALRMLAASDAVVLIIDLSGVTFMDSTGVNLLVQVNQAATEAGGRVKLRGVSASVRGLLMMTGLDAMFVLD